MKLRGIDFPPVVNAAGAQGFFGEGYHFHRYWKLAGLSFAGCGFIAKTMTLEPKVGHMPLGPDGISPRDHWPGCIMGRFWQGIMLNAVGLSNKGAPFLLQRGRWQQRREPFFLSVMAVSATPVDRQHELQVLVAQLQRYLPQFQAPVGLEMNFSCPNTGHDPQLLVPEIEAALEVAARLRIPLQIKLNVLVPPKVVQGVLQHPECDALTMSNSLPWGSLPQRINWPDFFGTMQSPLEERGFGSGGLSGKPLLPIVTDWIREARDSGITKPIWGGGGIVSVRGAKKMKYVGASGIQLGVIAALRPWRMPAVIRYAHENF